MTRLEGNPKHRTTSLALTTALMTAGWLILARPASAQCPYPEPYEFECSQGECHQSFTYHYCSWYGSQTDSCGSYCDPDVVCCGVVVDKAVRQCSSQCAGCQPGGRVALGAPKKGNSKEVAPAKESSAERKPTAQVGAKVSATVAVGHSAVKVR